MTLFRGSGSPGQGTDVEFLRSDRNLSDVDDANTARQNLGLVSLSDISSLTPTDSLFIVGDGSNWVGESGATARASMGVSIGSDVQAWSADLDNIGTVATLDTGTAPGEVPTNDDIALLRDPENATDSGTDTYSSETTTAVPTGGAVVSRDFQSANTTTTPTLDGKTLTTLDGSALWAGALNGVRVLQYDSVADTYLVVDPIPTAENVNNAPVKRDANGRARFADPSAAQDVVTKAHFDATARVVQHRSRINYNSGSSVQVMVPENLVMAGFRFMGSYRKGDGRYMSSGITAGQVVVSETSDLAVEDTVHAHNWYAVFAVANNADSAVTYVLMPFFRAGTVSGSTIPFAQGGEADGDTVTTTTYSGLATDELVGADVLVIQEGKVFSGRTTTVTANTDADVTVNTIGSIAANDFFLVAPPGWDDYVYLGSYYHDSAEPRNIADTGDVVGSYGIDNVDLSASGAIGTAVRLTAAGQVSPLATALRSRLTFSLSTASTGDVGHQFWHDSSTHFVDQHLYIKVGGSTESPGSQVMEFPFSKEQAVWIKTVGSLDGSVSGRNLRTFGWIEP